MNIFSKPAWVAFAQFGACFLAIGQVPIHTSWRYFRPGNTGIQGDYNEALWVAPDGNPWIAGYDPIAEEGGIAKFFVGENRWLNVSNVDYPSMGTANDVGFCRVTDMVPDNQGNVWMATWRGALRMNLATGPTSLVRFGPSNSTLDDGFIRDVERAPNGSIWFSGNGISTFEPTSNSWTYHAGRGGGMIASQAKPGGGFYVWSSNEGFTGMDRFDSTSATWTQFPATAGFPSHLASHDSSDATGHVWMMRWVGFQGEERLDCLKPDGTWLSPALPPVHPQVSLAALHAFGNRQLLMVDGYMHLQRYNGANWTDLGPVPHSGFIDKIDIDASGNIWICGTGTGGALRRDAVTGFWQRYRITNTSQFDLFAGDIAIHPKSGDVYVAANASPGVGGMVKFDGIRWTTFVSNLGYGLSHPWPFNATMSEGVYVRPSNGVIVANPLNNFTHEFDGITWTPLEGGSDMIRSYVEDSTGRLWTLPHYGGLGYFDEGVYYNLALSGWGHSIYVDPTHPGSIWAASESELVRTNSTQELRKSPSDFPNAASLFTGLAVEPKGAVWIGSWNQGSAKGSTLMRYEPRTDSIKEFRHGLNWPFPGDHVRPKLVTPDGRLWMTYDSEYPSESHGLLWFDGTRTGVFPAPEGNAWGWGGLPSGIINDIEMRPIEGGYELWISCVPRGIAVLKVMYRRMPK